MQRFKRETQSCGNLQNSQSRGLAVVLPLDFLKQSTAEVKRSVSSFPRKRQACPSFESHSLKKKHFFQVSQQWLHYEKGDFSTLGFPGDSLYPTKEIELTSNYSRPAESKQELLCGNARASKDSKRKDDKVDPSPPPAPIFTYSLPGRTTTQVHHHHHVCVLT